MPSLADAAGRMAGPAPAGIDADAHAVLRALWQTYPRAAAGWKAVLPADEPTPERRLALSEGHSLLDESMVRWDATPLRQQYERLRRLFRAPAFSRLGALADLTPLLAAAPEAPARWARLFFRAEVNDPRPEVLLGGYILQPFLYAFARRTLSGLPQEDWRRTRCPVCGGSPYHGYLHPPSGRKILVCGKCQCPWIAPRLRCPFCENTIQDALGFFSEEQTGAARIDYCTACRSILPITPYPESGCPFPLNDHLAALRLRSVVERRQHEH